MKLDPDSPQLSEWLDGRLTADEAAAVAAAVKNDPQLADVVSELRQVRRLLMEAGDAVVPAGPLAGRVMAALAGATPGNEDPFAHVNESPLPGSGHDEADDRDADRLVDEHVAKEWDRLERQRIKEDRIEASEDVEALLAARAGSGLADRGTRRWLAPVLGAALAAGLLLTVVLNFPQPGPPGELADRGDAQPSAALPAAEPEIDAAALAARMMARGIELTDGKQSIGVLRMTVRLGDREGRRRFEELLARSDVRLDRGESEEDGRIERIGCLGRADEVDRLLESLAVSGGGFSVASGSLSREATDRLERRGPVAEPMLAAADAQLQAAAADAAVADAIASDAAPPEAAAAGAAAEPQALVMAEPSQLRGGLKARSMPADAESARQPAAGLIAASPAAASPAAADPTTVAEGLAPGSAAMPPAAAEQPTAADGRNALPTADAAPPEPSAVAVRSMPVPAPVPAADAGDGPPAWLIAPEGYVRLWIDIIDDTQSESR